MSQQPPPSPNPFANQPSFNQPMPSGQPHRQQGQPTNGIGLTGFIFSLVGLFLCGIPSVIGLVISAFGLRKEPRGLAIAGVIIGLIGMIEFALVGISTYRGYMHASQRIEEVLAELEDELNIATTKTIMEHSAAEIGHRWEELERLPTQEEGDKVLIGIGVTDPMNNSLVYETDGSSFSIRSAGTDGVLETEDDIVVGPYFDPQTAIDLENQEIEFEESE